MRALLFIIITIINWMCRFGWVDSINFIAWHPSHPHHYDEFPILCQKILCQKILCHKRDSIMRYLLGPGGLSARPPLAQCKGSPVRADHIISIRSKLSKNHLRHPNHQDHNNSSIQIFCQRGTSIMTYLLGPGGPSTTLANLVQLGERALLHHH